MRLPPAHPQATAELHRGAGLGEPSDVDGAARGSSVDADPQSSVLQLLLNGSLADARWLQQAQHHFFTVSQSQKKGCCF
nr:photoreceptor disk component PRCD isoform X1 [Macaca fascicularis]